MGAQDSVAGCSATYSLIETSARQQCRVSCKRRTTTLQLISSQVIRRRTRQLATKTRSSFGSHRNRRTVRNTRSLATLANVAPSPCRKNFSFLRQPKLYRRCLRARELRLALQCSAWKPRIAHADDPRRVGLTLRMTVMQSWRRARAKQALETCLQTLETLCRRCLRIQARLGTASQKSPGVE